MRSTLVYCASRVCVCKHAIESNNRAARNYEKACERIASLPLYHEHTVNRKHTHTYTHVARIDWVLSNPCAAVVVLVFGKKLDWISKFASQNLVPYKSDGCCISHNLVSF